MLLISAVPEIFRCSVFNVPLQISISYSGLRVLIPILLLDESITIHSFWFGNTL